MRTLFFTLISLLFFVGCYDNYNNSVLPQETQPFKIAMSPSFAPSPVETFIPVNAQIILHASKLLKVSSVTPQSVHLLDNTTHLQHPIEVSLVSQKTIVIKPIIYLAGDHNYTIVITTLVESLAHEHLAEDAKIPFHSDSQFDFTEPALSSILPSGNIAVEPFVKIFFQFTEAISPLSINKDDLTLYDNNSSQYINGEFLLSNALITFIPDQDLQNGHDYTLKLNTANLRDLANNIYLGSSLEVLSFSVKATTSPLTYLSDQATPFTLNQSINTIVHDNDQTLYVGGGNGLDIFTYTTDVAGTFEHKAHLLLPSSAIVYKIKIDYLRQVLYLATSVGLIIVGINDISHPQLITTYPIYDLNGNPTAVYDLAFDPNNTLNNQLYLAATTGGILDLNISNTLNLQLIAQVDNSTINGITEVVSGITFAGDSNSQYTPVASYFNQGIKYIDFVSGSTSQIDNGYGKVYRNLLGTFEGFAIASGVKGIGVSYTGLFFTETPSYITRLSDKFVKSSGFAIAKYFGLISFDPTYGNINTLYPIAYPISAIGSTGYDNGGSLIFLGSDKGVLHAYHIP